MYASSKVTHAKYAVAEKADYCDTRIEKFITTAKLYFCIELQDFELMMNDVWCQKWMKTGEGHPLWYLLIGDDECQLIATSHKQTVLYMCRDQLYCWHKDMAPIVLLVASCIVPL